jgi:hypothetical protein
MLSWRLRRWARADPLRVTLLVALALVALWLVLATSPDGRPTALQQLLGLGGHAGGRSEDEVVANVLAELDADAHEATLVLAEHTRQDQQVAAADAAAGHPLPVADVGTAPPLPPGLDYTISNIYIPSTVGAYNLTASCRAAVRFLRQVERETESTILLPRTAPAARRGAPTFSASPGPSPSPSTSRASGHGGGDDDVDAATGSSATASPTRVVTVRLPGGNTTQLPRAVHTPAPDESLGEAGWLDGPHPSHPLYQALARARDPVTNVVVVVFASVQYHKLVVNWIRHMQRLGVRNVLLLALDTASATLLAVEDLQGMVVFPLVQGDAMDRYRVKIFMIRYQVFTYALCAGVHVVMSDVDAIWLRNPVPHAFLDATEDCVFSGDGMPGELKEKWGAATTICFGFLFCRANERSLALAAAGQAYLPMRQDDQVAINYGLAALNMTAEGLVPDVPMPTAPGARDIYAYYERSWYGRTEAPVGLRFVIVSRSLVTRHCGLSMHASTWKGLVAHCIVRQKAEDKEEMLRLKGMWLV